MLRVKTITLEAAAQAALPLCCPGTLNCEKTKRCIFHWIQVTAKIKTREVVTGIVTGFNCIHLAAIINIQTAFALFLHYSRLK